MIVKYRLEQEYRNKDISDSEKNVLGKQFTVDDE